MENQIEFDSLAEVALFEYRFKLGTKIMFEMLVK